ncbi:PREDICTED: cell cycle exit and neuronal differentiation protein 1-like [Capra hircus]|uniref:cell cycle exit and neuronal differentiation protein 1-like n=1 Tax=Capra hircus TaxID=9925 RepID=UPI0008469090|nr:PREDICTED: cell cycle exit and neuronal differentiation protein 1-like [Capra hircus]
MKHKERSADTPDSVRELRVRQPKSKKPFSKATDGVTGCCAAPGLSPPSRPPPPTTSSTVTVKNKHPETPPNPPVPRSPPRPEDALPRPLSPAPGAQALTSRLQGAGDR